MLSNAPSQIKYRVEASDIPSAVCCKKDTELTIRFVRTTGAVMVRLEA
jgi:hypothetical protein